MTAFFALQGWRARVEWEDAVRQLRPFVTSQRWYDALVAPAGDAPAEPPAAPDPFGTLCAGMLNTTVAYLIPVGPIATLIAAQCYPADRTASVLKISEHPERVCQSRCSTNDVQSKDATLSGRPLRSLRLRAAALRSGCSATFSSDVASRAAGPPALGSLAGQIAGLDDLALSVDPAQYGGATWAVALGRDRRGADLAGVLLLGPRRGGGLYTQEEIEIARAACERIMDLAAGVALSQRLMRLQREQMTTTQVLDQRTRRALHDEVLPLIHTAMLTLASGATAEAAIQQLSAAHQEVSNLLRALPPTAAPEIARLGLIEALKRMVGVEFASAFAAVTWDCAPGVEAQVKRLSPLVAETLYYAAREAVRNASRHARLPDQPAGVRLAITVQPRDGQLQLTIADNGSGLPQTPGTGQGLALHSTLMAVAGGSLTLETTPGAGTRVVLAAPSGM